MSKLFQMVAPKYERQFSPYSLFLCGISSLTSLANLDAVVLVIHKFVGTNSDELFHPVSNGKPIYLFKVFEANTLTIT